MYAVGLVQGKPLNQSFYPYYGSTQSLQYTPLAAATYKNTFIPYTTINITDTYAPAYQPGYPTALNITSSSMTLAASLYKAATVYYVVLPTSVVSEALCILWLILCVQVWRAFMPTMMQEGAQVTAVDNVAALWC